MSAHGQVSAHNQARVRTDASIPGIHGRLMPHPFLVELIGTSPGSDDEARRARRAFRRWHRESRLGPAASLRTIADVVAAPLARVLGYDILASMDARGDVAIVDLVGAHHSGRRAASFTRAGGRLPLLVGPWNSRLDRWRRTAVLAARARRMRWALLFNGTQLHLADAASALHERGTLVDLTIAASDARCFAVLWMLARADATLGEADPIAALVARADRFAAGVGRSLRDGVLTAASLIVSTLFTPRHGVDAAFEQAVTIVYRILFLLFAESRELVPLWHPVYRRSYSLAGLRDAAERGRRAGLWEAFRAICRLAHAGCRIDDLTVTAFNGRLFDAARVPLLERPCLDDGSAERAILALTSRPSTRGREPISYRDLGVEQLGAIYETLLDYRPRVRSDGMGTGPVRSAGARRARDRAEVVLERGASTRKASGSFYTPQSLARYLVARTLEPLVRNRRPDEVLELKVVDPSAGSGAFLVTACHFLAAAYEDALVASGACLPDDIGPAERTGFRRLVAERCLYGVDVNPMAVQLTRLSLWLTTLAWDKPLSFLDHHVRSGDSLLGAWLASLSRPPDARRRAAASDLPLFAAAFETDAFHVLPARLALASPNESLADVRAKERALADLERPGSILARWRRVADLWCARWFAGEDAPPASAFRALADAALQVGSALPDHVSRRWLDAADRLAGARRFFHWELEFPEVFFDASGRRREQGGFDAVIGNPPWDMMRADAGPPEARHSARVELGRVRRFARDSGLYEASGDGHGNRYQLFLERGIDLLAPEGRLGLVLPGGLATDHASARLRRLLFRRCEIDGLVGFDNRRRIFPVHRSVRFVLVTATAGRPTLGFGVRFGESDPSVLDDETSGRPAWYPVRVSVDALDRLSGGSLVVPEWRTPADVAIVERAAALYPPLSAPDGWSVRFGRELNATDDRALFGAPGAGVPVIEGKLLEPFGVRADASRRSVKAAVASARLGQRWQRPRLAYRDVAGATNRLTLIAAILPAGVVSTHTLTCLRTPLSLERQHLLCGLFNSLVVNYLVRFRVGTHVTTDLVERLPLPRPADAPEDAAAIAALARRPIPSGAAMPAVPAAGARRSARRARASGGPDDGTGWRGMELERFGALNARVARLYRLSREELAHVLDTFPLVPPGDRACVLEHFDRQRACPDGHA